MLMEPCLWTAALEPWRQVEQYQKRLVLFYSTNVSSLGRYVFGSEISYNKAPPACLG
jgi:hypothetical protein